MSDRNFPIRRLGYNLNLTYCGTLTIIELIFPTFMINLMIRQMKDANINQKMLSSMNNAGFQGSYHCRKTNITH